MNRNDLKATIRAIAFMTLASTLPAAAETVEVTSGVQVTKRTYTAPVNEQPFFGFAAKTAEQKAEDDKFVGGIEITEADLSDHCKPVIDAALFR